MNLKAIHEAINDIEAGLHTADEFFIGVSTSIIEELLAPAEGLRRMIPQPLHINNGRIHLFGEMEVILVGETHEQAYERLYDIGCQTGCGVYKHDQSLDIYGERQFMVRYWDLPGRTEVHSIQEVFTVFHNSEVE